MGLVYNVGHFGLDNEASSAGYVRIVSIISFKCIGKAPETGQQAVRSYWCPEYNLSSFTLYIYMKGALGQVGEYVHLYV